VNRLILNQVTGAQADALSPDEGYLGLTPAGWHFIRRSKGKWQGTTIKSKPSLVYRLTQSDEIKAGSLVLPRVNKFIPGCMHILQHPAVLMCVWLTDGMSEESEYPIFKLPQQAHNVELKRVPTGAKCVKGVYLARIYDGRVLPALPHWHEGLWRCYDVEVDEWSVFTPVEVWGVQ
jgi:hypothetical protein